MIQAVANDTVKYKVTKGNDYKQWLALGFLYIISFVVVDGEMSLAVRLAVALGYIILMMSSYPNAVAVMLVVIFLPIAGNVLGQEISGVKLPRLLFFIFLYMSWKKKRLRKLQFTKSILFLLLFSTIVIIIFADIQQTLQTVPLSAGQPEAKGLKNFIAHFIDQLIIIIFLLVAYTRLNFKQLSNLYNVLILAGFFQGINVLYMFGLHPEKVFFGPGFDKTYLWQSLHFGHKNDWGMMFVFMFFITFIRSFLDKENKLLYFIAIGVSVSAVGISMSRQAYVWLVMGFILISVWRKNTKLILYFFIAVIALVIIQPKFLVDRMESMVAVESLEDAKNINRKISDLSIDQAVSYFTFVPRVFVIEWEYNWSEGFWVGILHNTGILGFFGLILMYMKFFTHYQKFSKLNNLKLSSYGILLMTFMVMMFLANFNRRYTHFAHYNGNIGQIGMIVIFMMFYTELMYHGLKRKATFVKNM